MSRSKYTKYDLGRIGYDTTTNYVLFVLSCLYRLSLISMKGVVHEHMKIASQTLTAFKCNMTPQ